MLTSLLMLGTILAFSQHYRPNQGANIPRGNFNSIEVKSDIEVVLSNSSSSTVRIEGPQKVVDKVSVRISGNTLKLDMSGSYYSGQGRVVAYVSVNDLRAITLEDDARVLANDTFEVDALYCVLKDESTIDGLSVVGNKVKIQAKNTSEASLRVDVRDLIIDAVNLATVTVRGTVEDVTVSKSVLSDVNIDGLRETRRESQPSRKPEPRRNSYWR